VFLGSYQIPYYKYELRRFVVDMRILFVLLVVLGFVCFFVFSISVSSSFIVGDVEEKPGSLWLFNH